ncbi:MAG: hypothetical protein JEZ08_24360 [Clostridiales bacterium]|nr:hypothetical protein [Clostridiales bacterium]
MNKNKKLLILFSTFLIAVLGVFLYSTYTNQVMDKQSNEIIESETVSSWDSPSTAVVYEPVGDPNIDFLNHSIVLIEVIFEVSSFSHSDNIITIELENSNFTDRDIDIIKTTIINNMSFYEVKIDDLEIRVIAKQ